MKQFKLFIWIFALVLLRTVLSVFLNIRGIVPDVLFAFTIAYAAYEKSLNFVLWVTIICAVIMSAVSAYEFWMVMLVFVYSAAAMYMSYSKFSRVSGAVRSLAGAAVFTAAGELFMYMASSLSFKISILLNYIAPMVVCNMILAAVIYKLLEKSFDKRDDIGKLIIS